MVNLSTLPPPDYITISQPDIVISTSRPMDAFPYEVNLLLEWGSVDRIDMSVKCHGFNVDIKSLFRTDLQEVFTDIDWGIINTMDGPLCNLGGSPIFIEEWNHMTYQY